MADNGVIGRAGALPWRLPDDLAHFKAVTLGHPVVMGRKTFASLGKPLPGRLNLVLTRAAPAWSAPGVTAARSFAAAVAQAQASGSEWLWVIGGAEVYALTLPLAHRLEVTRVRAAVDGDVVFPRVDWKSFERVDRSVHESDARHAFEFAIERWQRRARG